MSLAFVDPILVSSSDSETSDSDIFPLLDIEENSRQSSLDGDDDDEDDDEDYVGSQSQSYLEYEY